MNFNSLFALLTAIAAAGSPLLLACALKGGVILGTASLLSVTLRRASATARHLVWLLAILGVLCLPLLSLIMPPLRLPTTPPAAALTSPPLALTQPPAHIPTLPQRGGHTAALISPPAPPHVLITALPQEITAQQAPDPGPWPLFLTTVWAVVAGLALTRLGLGFFFAEQVTRRCLPVTDPTLLAEMQRLIQAAGLRRSVSLRQGAAVAVPMTTGLCRPVVLLPADAGAWPTDRLRAALRHELAHIARRDWAWHGLAGVACALHWFNPLVWLAARQLRESSERACDDAVLAAGSLPADYAGHLLEIARQLSARRASRPGAAIAMAQRPQVEDRLRAILRTGLDRRSLTRRSLLLALGAAALVLLPIAAFRTAALEQSKDDARWKAHEQTAALEQSQDKARRAAYKIELSNLRHLNQIGRAVIVFAHNHGGRLPNADHWVDEIAPTVSAGSPALLRSFMQDPAAPAQSYGYAFNRSLSGVNLATVKNSFNVALVFESALDRRDATDTGASVPVPGRYHGGSHYVFADGQVRWMRDGAKVSYSPVSAPRLPIGWVGPVQPPRTAVLTGRVVYADGRPAANVRVGATIPSDVFQKRWGFWSSPAPPPGVRWTKAELAAFEPSFTGGEAMTGPDGTYHIQGLTGAPYNIWVLPRDDKAKFADIHAWVAAPIEGAAAEDGKAVMLRDLVLTAGGLISGRVTDVNGKPLAGMGVASDGPHPPGANWNMHTWTSTGPDGCYQLRVVGGSSHLYLGDSHWHAAEVTLTIAEGEKKSADFQAVPTPPRAPATGGGGYPSGILR